VAAVNRRERAHELAAALVTELGRELVVPDPVLVEVDQLLRRRISSAAARAFLAAITRGEHSTAFMTPALVSDAVAIDSAYRSLDLGFVDAAVMAIAGRHDLPILTFDFEHFRAAPPPHGYWRLVVDEARYIASTS
jgi:predicted nucleic acid-binding protein